VTNGTKKEEKGEEGKKIKQTKSHPYCQLRRRIIELESLWRAGKHLF